MAEILTDFLVVENQLKNLFNDNDWSLIDEFEQDTKLISNRFVSREYRVSALNKLPEKCYSETLKYFTSFISFMHVGFRKRSIGNSYNFDYLCSIPKNRKLSFRNYVKNTYFSHPSDGHWLHY